MSDLRAAIADAVKMAPESTPGNRYEQIADAVLAVPGLRQAWERSQAIDAYFEALDVVRHEHRTRGYCPDVGVVGLAMAETRLRGVSKEPT